LNRNFQFGVHPDADQLSVFVEGTAASWEHERMLAHLAECAECRKAVFFMQPHEQTQLTTRTPVRGWIWGRLLPIGLPAAAIACVVIATFIYFRSHQAAPPNPQQIASVRQPEIALPRTTIAPTTDSEPVAQSGRPQSSFASGAAMTDVSPGKNIVAGNSNLPTLKKDRDEATANIAASEKAAGAPSISVPAADAARVSSIGGALAASELPSNGRSVTNLQQLSTAQRAQVTTSRNVLADEKDLPPLKVERAAGQDGALAGISGHITDRSGANIAGAKVTVQDATGKTRETTAGADGSFHLTELPA
jgi:hypothetical protein